MKKNKEKPIFYEKRLGELSEKEWNNEKKRMKYIFLVISGFTLVIAFLVITGTVAAVNGSLDITKWFGLNKQSEYKNVKLYESEIKQTFYGNVLGNKLNLKLEVLLDNGSYFNIGIFQMEFTRVTVFNGNIPSDAYVLYTPPDEWYTRQAYDISKYEEIHVPIEKQKVGTDPTFVKNKDYPYNLYPFDEIEITTNKVIKIIERNETIYDFYVRIKESNKDFNIQDLRVSIS